MTSIAVIGAGIAGAAVARKLAGNATVSVFEKSRGVGGRLSARRAETAVFNHGAQFFTARSDAFQTCLAGDAVSSVVAEWQPKIITLQAGEKPFKRLWYEPHFVAAPQMNSLVKAVLADLPVHTGVRVGRLQKLSRGWELFGTADDSLGHFEWVVSTAPAPQALELFDGHFAFSKALQRIEYSPCFALMLGFDRPPALKFDCAVVRNSPIEWISVNSSRPGRNDDHGLVVHSSNAWAAQHVDADEDWIIDQLQQAMEDLLDIRATDANYRSLHRWRYARVEKALEQQYLLDADAQLAACGDWCLGNRVEDGYNSGLALGQAMRKQLACQ